MVMSEFEQSAAQRVPPHSLEAEMLLGAMLLSATPLRMPLSTPRRSTSIGLRTLTCSMRFPACTSGDPADPVTVATELERMGVLEMVSGLDGLISLQVNTPATSNAGKYTRSSPTTCVA